MELWGGFECTVNRVGDLYFDQCELTGHASRLEDLYLLPNLGVKAVRYPVLWERTQQRDGVFDFTWADERLALLTELGIPPIVGLLHHGSGPPCTSLLDPEFPQKFAMFARVVAERYPFVASYTPINEPLTTARFSALYGHWYPHKRDARSFTQALVAQCEGTQLAMREIRAVNPRARLIQTEDLGKSFSSPLLRYQADFENERRWLTFDLLCGRVDSSHPLWNYLVDCGGADVQQLARLREAPTPPDTLGINHYITSLRYLDHELEHYPEELHGGNFQHRYADVEAVRVVKHALPGHRDLLLEASERYGLPLAITEVQLASTEDERLRWFHEAWTGALDAVDKGADVQAVTCWALVGAVGWDRLVCDELGCYEASAFEVVDGVVRETPLVEMLTCLAGGGSYSHPHLEQAGWWRRPERVLYPSAAPHPDHECHAKSRS